MAMYLQSLCVKLGVVTGKDLAQACREQYSKPVSIVLWVLCEIAIIACDLAEVIGSAVALNLLFGIPLVWGVILTGFDVMLLLAAMHFGFRKIEAIVLTLVSTIALCFALQIFLAQPDWGGVALGMLVPTLPGAEAFYIALGILGATVMPHNLYLHTALVQTRDIGPTVADKRQAVRYNITDTVVALGAAFFVNAAILIVAAAVFHRTGQHRGRELAGGAPPARAAPGCADRLDRLRGGAPRLRAVLDDHRHARRADRHGGLPADPYPSLGAAAHHATAGDRTGGHPDLDLGRQGHRGACWSSPRSCSRCSSRSPSSRCSPSPPTAA